MSSIIYIYFYIRLSIYHYYTLNMADYYLSASTEQLILENEQKKGKKKKYTGRGTVGHYCVYGSEEKRLCTCAVFSHFQFSSDTYIHTHTYII